MLLFTVSLSRREFYDFGLHEYGAIEKSFFTLQMSPGEEFKFEVLVTVLTLTSLTVLEIKNTSFIVAERHTTFQKFFEC